MKKLNLIELNQTDGGGIMSWMKSFYGSSAKVQPEQVQIQKQSTTKYLYHPSKGWYRVGG